MAHLFFCCETNCAAEAHVLGGRCDGCFETHVVNLREAHNPTRCDHCHECVNTHDGAAVVRIHECVNTHDGSAVDCGFVVFCGKWCEAGWLDEHNCNGEWDEDLEVYNCTECSNCYNDLRNSRDLAERFYLGECYGETDEGYEAARAWYLGKLGKPPMSQQAYDLGKKLMLWTGYHECNGDMDYVRGYKVCDNHDDPCCPQYRAPAAIESQHKLCTDCGFRREETEPVLNCAWYCNHCWESRFGLA